jgi:hypothetical protein
MSASFEQQSTSLLEVWTQRFHALDAEQEAPSTDVDSPAPRASKLPARMWEIGDKLLCPVVGTCLSIEEVRKLARKFGVIPADAGDYAAHVTVVSHCKKRNALAEAVQQTLDRKHALWLGRFAKLKSESEALNMWLAALERGEAAGAMWGALTCRAATAELRQRVYEDVHMLSHQLGAGARADLAHVDALEKRLSEMEAEARRYKRRNDEELASRAMRIRHLEQALASAELRARQADALRQQLDEQATARRMDVLERSLAAAVAHAEAMNLKVERAQGLEERLTALQAEFKKQTALLKGVQAERDALERYLDAPQPCDACIQDADDNRADFAGQRLLCVGGRTHLQAQYRSLVERAGGTLLYHDGGREEALSRLPEMLGQADAVICPIDCVGHPAYYQLKRHCKQAGKPCVLLRRSGLASFAEGLRRLADGQTEFSNDGKLGETESAMQVILKV